MWFDSAALMQQQLAAQADLWLEAPNARGMIRDGVEARALRVRFAMEALEPGVSLRLALLDDAGRAVAELRPDRGQGGWQPDITALLPGAYRIVAEAARGDGGVMVSDVAPLDIVPPGARGLFFRPDQVALLGGKPWFPIGVCSMPVLDPVAERVARNRGRVTGSGLGLRLGSERYGAGQGVRAEAMATGCDGAGAGVSPFGGLSLLPRTG